VITAESRGVVHVVHMTNAPNLFNRSFLDALGVALDEALADQGAGALVLTGEGKFFSNGFDLEFLGSLDPEPLLTFIHDAQSLVARILAFPMPTVAAVNGHAFGIAAILALAHDVRVMRADRGWISLPEIELGLPFQPFMTALLRARLDDSTLSEAVLTARRYTGPEAVAGGIVHEAVDDTALIDRAVAIASARAGKGREITATLKQDLYAPVLSTLG
jgi:Delta3-Delta2-enoyl-CoA isomerase